MAVRVGHVAGGMHPGRPIAHPADIGADAGDPLLVDLRPDIVDQDRGHTRRLGRAQQHGEEAPQRGAEKDEAVELQLPQQRSKS
jgi:hypothetical protein